MTATEAGKRRLGRGLAALIGDELDESAALDDTRGLRTAPIDRLSPNPANPRRRMDEVELDELARSIREKGLLQPILVRPLEETGGALGVCRFSARFLRVRSFGPIFGRGVHSRHWASSSFRSSKKPGSRA